jgi:NNP family nitrate/nitrite transporter-like MFS transporter
VDKDNRASETSRDPNIPFRSQLGPVIVLTIIFYLTFVSRIILAPLLPNIEQELNITHGEAGAFFLLISLGYFASMMGSGFVSSKVTHRSTISISVICLGLSLLLLSQCSGLRAICVSLLMLGISAGLYLPSGMANLTAIFDSGHWGKAFAIHEMGPILSFLTAPLLVEFFLSWFSWRTILILLGSAAILVGITFGRFGRGGNFCGEAPNLGSLKTLFAVPGVWYLLILFGLGISGTVGIYSMLPLYLVVEKGLGRSWANMLIATSRLSGLGTVFFAGWAADKLGARRTLIVIFLLSGLVTMSLGIADNFWLVITVILQPLLASCFFPAGFAALALIIPATIRNIGVSFIVPLGFIIGAGAIPMLIGAMGDSGTFAAGIVITGVMIFCGTFLSRFLKMS